MSDRLELARAAYRAYETRDREQIESLIADDFVFHAPPDPHLDREGYFERCWPNADLIDSYEIIRLIEHGDEVVITYETTKADGGRFRNTEVLRFEGDRIAEVEVYFGWDVPE